MHIVAVTVAIGFFYIGVPWIHSRFSRWSLKRKVVRSKAVVFTFDDGPGTRLTPMILDILAKNSVKATFFLLGKRIQGNEAVVRQIAAAEHEICSHGYEHLHYWTTSPFRALADIRKGWQAISTVLGRKTIYPFRPPYGKLNLICLLYLMWKRIPIVYWTIDIRDTWAEPYENGSELASLVKRMRGAVTIAHDFDRSNSATDDIVIGAIRSILKASKESGLRTLTVSQLLGFEER